MSGHFVSYEKLIAYAADELDERESELVADHVVACAECTATVSMFQAVREIVRADALSPNPPPAVVDRAKAIFPEHIVSYEELIAYAANDLDEVEATRVAEHLPTCEKCAATITRFRMIHYLMSAHHAESPPAATLVRAQNHFASIDRPVQRERKWIRLFDFVPVSNRFAVAAIAILILIVPLLFAGSRTVANTAQAAIPGDTLYPVKTTLENTQINLALDSATKTELYLSFTHERVEEMTALAAKGKYEDIPEVTKTFETQVEKVTLNLTTAIASGPDSRKVELSQKVDNALSQYSSTLTKLNESGPAEVKPSLERAVAVSSEQQKIVRGMILNSSPSLPATLLPAPTTGVPVLVVATPTGLWLPTATPFLLPSSTPAIPTATPLGSPTSTPVFPTATPIVPLPTTVLIIPTAVIEKYMPTIVPVSPTSVIEKAVPTATLVPPPPTRIPILPTATPLPPTSVPIAPTAAPGTLPTPTPLSPSPVVLPTITPIATPTP